MENSRRVVEEEIKRAKQETKDQAAGQPSLLPAPKKKMPAAVVPVHVHLEMSPTQFARYESVWEQVRKRRDLPTEKVEALLKIMASFLEDDVQNPSPRGEITGNSRPPAQIHIHHCPECESAVVQTSKGELEIGKQALQRAQCDCQVNKPGQRNTTSIPPATRRRVFSNARHKCQTPGCNHTRFLEVHHKIPRARGGTNDPENLQALCSACHALIHNTGAGFLVKSPSIIYAWNSHHPTNSPIARQTEPSPRHESLTTFP